MDAYVSGYYRDELSYENGFRVASVVEHFVTYGIVLSGEGSGNTNSSSTTTATAKKVKQGIVDIRIKNEDGDGYYSTGGLRQCILQFTSLRQSDINDIVQQNSDPLEVVK